MSYFRVLIRKTGYLYGGPTNINLSLVSYMDDLTRQAFLTKGFINSQNFWEKNTLYKDDIVQVCTISDWKSSHDWEKWLISDERKKIYENYKEIVINEQFSDLYKNNSVTDMFLL